MSSFKRISSGVLIILFGLSTVVIGQDKSSAKVDSSYQTYMQDAWKEIRKSEKRPIRDSLQSKYSEEFYDYYKQHPETKTGKRALKNAVVMWGNTGNDEHVDEVLDGLDYDSEIWGKVINSVANLYYRNEDRDIENYYKMLWDLKEKLTDPKSKSSVILRLLRKNMDEDKEVTEKLAKELIELDAADFYVRLGEGALHELESLNEGQKAPGFTAKKVSGEKVSLSDLEGNYVLIDFWATWCGPCMPEIPHLKTLWEEHQDKNFEMVSISFDRKKKKLKKFLEEREMEWSQVFKPKGWKSEIAQLYNVTGIPRTFLIGPEGEIIAKDLRGEKMIKEVEKHLAR